MFIYYFILSIGVVMAVSFYTLYERKFMSSSHLRIGPEIVGWWGLVQPFSDGMKLFTKEGFVPSKSNYIIYTFCCGGVLSLSLMAWSTLPINKLLFNFGWMVVIILLITGGGVYCHLGMGWGSNSIYGFIGGIRCVAQSLSYEVSLAFLFLSVTLVWEFIDLSWFERIQGSVWGVALLPTVAFLWWVSSVAETNRSPFDFAEGESELVSGFNVEYGSGFFASIYIHIGRGLYFKSVRLVSTWMSGSSLLLLMMAAGFFT